MRTGSSQLVLSQVPKAGLGHPNHVDMITKPRGYGSSRKMNKHL